MSIVHSSDPDFRVCQISFDTLLDIQLEAESREWATRWTSVDALRSQVKEGDVLLQSLMREQWSGTLRTYRCLALFSSADGNGGAIATVDLDPARYLSLERLDRDPDVRKALVRMFSLAMAGISMISKR